MFPSSPISYNTAAFASPLFEGDKRRKKGRVANNAPDVKPNDVKKHGIGTVVAFRRGNFKLTKTKEGVRWVKTHESPKGGSTKFSRFA